MAGEIETSALLRLHKLRFRWPGAATNCLDVESLDLQAREAVFLRGPSGCGKSTLLSLMAGVLKADSGSVNLLGHNLNALSATARDRLRADHIGYVFQQFNLLPYLSVMDNVLLPCQFSVRRLKQAGGSSRALDAAAALLAAMGLPATFWQRPATDRYW